MKMPKWSVVVALSSLIACISAAEETNLAITSFSDGLLTWTNVNPNLYYTVEWRPSLTGTNDWSGSYRGSQDLRSTNEFVTVPVPIFYRIVGTTNPVHTRTLSDTTLLVQAGYYEATNLAAVDGELARGNIRAGVTVFGVTGKNEVVDTTSGDATAAHVRAGKKAWVDGAELTGTAPPAGVPKTGQTTVYRTGDDGTYQKGVASPSPRFTDNADGTVTDNLTGLMWTKNANIWGGLVWNTAVNNCQGYSLAGYSDWRLPNLREMGTLIDYREYNPALPSGHPFTGVQWWYYWSSTTFADDTAYAWIVYLGAGGGNVDNKVIEYYVWPVRGGQ